MKNVPDRKTGLFASQGGQKNYVSTQNLLTTTFLDVACARPFLEGRYNP